MFMPVFTKARHLEKEKFELSQRFSNNSCMSMIRLIYHLTNKEFDVLFSFLKMMIIHLGSFGCQ